MKQTIFNIQSKYDSLNIDGLIIHDDIIKGIIQIILMRHS